MVSTEPQMSLEGGETDSGVVVETIIEYSSQTHLLTKNSVFGVRVRLDSSKGAKDKDERESQNMGTSTEEMKGGDESSSLSTSSFTASSSSSSSSSLMRNPKGSGENKDDKSNEGSAVVKFAVSELFVKKGCTSPSPAAVSCKNCGKKLGPYINFGALVGHAKYCSRDDLHTCEICNKRFNRFSLYQKHIYREHGIGFSDNDFSCASCGKGFQSESLLFKHLKRTKCGLSDGVKRKANASAGSCVSSSGSSSSGGGGKSTKMRKKVAQKEPETNTPLLGKKCKTVALVNHSGHMDWLLSCNTLLCSESEKGEAHESWHHGDEYQHEHQLLDPNKDDQHHDHNMKSSSLNHPNIRPDVNFANHGNEVGQEGKREADEADIQCFMGCEQHVYKDGAKQCERLLNATRVRHNDHWDYVVNDRLLHVYQDPTLGQIQEDHGSFKFLSEDLEFDW